MKPEINSKLIIAHGKVSEIDDSKPVQFLKCDLLEGNTEIPRIQNYGLSSHPPANSHVLAVCAGHRKDLVGISVQAKKRPHNLNAGEVVLYNENIELSLKGTKAQFSTKNVEVAGVDLLQTLSEIVDFLLMQAPLKPEARFIDIKKLSQIKSKLLGSL